MGADWQTTAVDLQSHSVHSDGELEVAGVVAAAVEAGVELLALTDHDTIDGVQEAVDLASHNGLRVIPATEISAVDGDYEDLHILGYGIDHHDPLLCDRLAEAREDRDLRAQRMGERLRELGFELDEQLLSERRSAGKPIGRPHLAQAVLSHPSNRERLSEEGHDNVSSFIPAYLIPKMPAYAGRTRPTVNEAVAWIHEAGGTAVWAHPFWDIKDDREVLAAIDRFAASPTGIDGVEAFYVTHDRAQTLLLSARCADLGLLATASSDYHGPHHRLFHRFLAYERHGLRVELGPLLSGRSVLTD